ncbi:retropepsin-like aspartic protease [Pseudoalteromonas piscicida]|nr:retropepsin-like aspartic protease [Pseudoalteromonas piscicida]
MKLDKVAELNLGEHTNAALFGRPFFEHFVIQLDYPNSKMRIIDHESINLNKLKNIKLIKQRGSGMPIVEISLKEDKSIWLLLDTGNNGGIVIERNVAKSMGWLDTLERNSVISTGANSSAVSEDFRVPWIKFGPFELENVLISIPEEGQRTHLVSQHKTTGSRIKGKRVQGAIGYDVLKHFLITLDYRGGYAHIGLPEE